MRENIALHFGAGNIGRGLIGKILFESGFYTYFVDSNRELVSFLNKNKSYKIYSSSKKEDMKIVKNISAIIADEEKIEFLLANKVHLITTAVGATLLHKIAPAISKIIRERFKRDNKGPLNIICAENVLYASSILKRYVYENLAREEKIFADNYIAFPNAIVDTIVPQNSHLEDFSLRRENFFEFIVEKNAFKGESLKIKGIFLSEFYEAYAERKLFTLNTGHATLAYLGAYKGYKTILDAIKDEEIFKSVSAVMRESGEVLIRKFNFKREEHYSYINSILARFKNPYINDSIERVARDPIRKLKANERFIKPLNGTLKYNLENKYLIKAITMVLLYKNLQDREAQELNFLIEKKGVDYILREISKIKDAKLRESISLEYLRRGLNSRYKKI